MPRHLGLFVETRDVLPCVIIKKIVNLISGLIVANRFDWDLENGVLIIEIHLSWKLEKLSKGIVRNSTGMHVGVCREIKSRHW